MPRKRKRKESETFVDVETIDFDSTDPLGLEASLSPSKRRYLYIIIQD